jgi:hypothetical protein
MRDQAFNTIAAKGAGHAQQVDRFQNTGLAAAIGPEENIHLL